MSNHHPSYPQGGAAGGGGGGGSAGGGRAASPGQQQPPSPNLNGADLRRQNTLLQQQQYPQQQYGGPYTIAQPPQPHMQQQQQQQYPPYPPRHPQQGIYHQPPPRPPRNLGPPNDSSPPLLPYRNPSPNASPPVSPPLPRRPTQAPPPPPPGYQQQQQQQPAFRGEHPFYSHTVIHQSHQQQYNIPPPQPRYYGDGGPPPPPSQPVRPSSAGGYPMQAQGQHHAPYPMQGGPPRAPYALPPQQQQQYPPPPRPMPRPQPRPMPPSQQHYPPPHPHQQQSQYHPFQPPPMVSSPLVMPQSQQQQMHHKPLVHSLTTSSLSSLPPPQPRYPQRHSGGSMHSSPLAQSRHPHLPTPPPRVDSDPPSETNTLVNVGRRDSATSTLNDLALPVIYPAMLSMVAEAFRAKVPLANRSKDSLEYNECFVGREAVDTIAYLIKSTDRNLSLLLGRALDAQKFFHDVTYNHRLRDSSNELYKFQAQIPMTPVLADPLQDGASYFSFAPTSPTLLQSLQPIDPEDGGLPNGVFTLLTDCYSPTCTRDRLCYSIACPRRLEQQTRIVSQMSSQLQRTPSRVSLNDFDKQHQLWFTSVPKEIVESVSDSERKRQEVIFETIQTEREFVTDLDIIGRVFVEPLRHSQIIPADRMEEFIDNVFYNVDELYQINSLLLAKLLTRQKESSIVDKIGDIFISIVDSFEAYVRYGAQQVLARYHLDQERTNNPEFAKFLQECERNPDCRKLPVQSFLARPTTRIGRYPLLLKSAMDAAADHHPDRTLLPQAIHVIREVLSSINLVAGRAENKLKLEQLQQSLVFNPGEIIDLDLGRPETFMAREGHLVIRKNGSDVDLQVFLFDHMLLLTKVKKAGLHKVYKRPIPLEFLIISDNHGTSSRRASGMFGQGHRSGSSASGSFSHPTPPSLQAAAASNGQSMPGPAKASNPLMAYHRANTASGSGSSLAALDITKGFPFTITHLGREGGVYTLYAASQADRRTWRDAIEQQKSLRTVRHRPPFKLVTLFDTTFPHNCRANSSTVYKDRILVGTDQGMFVAPLESTHPDALPSYTPLNIDLLDKESSPPPPTFRKVLEIEKISQVDVLPDHGMITLLAEKSLWTFPIDVLDGPPPVTDPTTTTASAALASVTARGEKISGHLNFYKNGVCRDRTFISGVRLTALNSRVKIYEPVAVADAKKRGKLGKFFAGADVSVKTFKVSKEFYIPAEASSIHYLRTKLCVGCSKGFEVVDLETLMPQGLIDAEDDRMDFVNKREGLKPISIFRLASGDFLLCYNEFGFYIDRFGVRTKHDALIQWTGFPTHFTFIPPYIIAYEPSFVEIRDVDSGELVQIVPTSNLRVLNSEPEKMHMVVDAGFDTPSLVTLRQLPVDDDAASGASAGDVKKR
ncbi:RHO1 GDP-GTP exchange protein 2 [Thoreauomyces humboldtii]|nr:RHO1 GDP-GTP exchange protein 2 [Thoreauomyces humboldtii]